VAEPRHAGLEVLLRGELKQAVHVATKSLRIAVHRHYEGPSQR